MLQGVFKPYDNTEVDYTYSSPEPMTMDYPGCPGEVDFGSIRINGKPAGKDLEGDLFDAFGDDWEGKIFESISQAKADYAAERGEYLYEQHRDRMLERGMA